MEKHRPMKSFIAAALEYSKHPSETTASILQTNLGTIGASLDLSLFDPGSSIAAEFYVSLHELMNSLASRSTLIWSALAVLQHACKNTAARNALIHTYKFTPILNRLLEANLTAEKRIRVLQLLQELTYGVKISWQEAHLPYLISTLTQWVSNSTEEDVVALSLGVLVNLCYKNLHAIYTLMRTVDTKSFIKTLLRVQCYNINTRVQGCKLLIILEHVNRKISDREILDFAEVTFTSIVTALKGRDAPLLRHTVDFFEDVIQNEQSRAALITYPSYSLSVENILAELKPDSDPECVALMMEFLSSLIRLQLPCLSPLYSDCIKAAMTWAPVEQVCPKALSLIRTVVTDIRRIKGSLEILNELDFSVLMLVLDTNTKMDDGENSQSVESQAKLTEFLQLLQEMVRINSLRPKVMQIFNDQAMRQILTPVLEQGDKSTSENAPGNLFQDPATTLNIYALSLTADLAAHDSNWLTLYSELLRKRQIQVIMAHALYSGDIEVKQKVLQLMSSSVGFPQECVSAIARSMHELEPFLLIQNATGYNSSSRDRNTTSHGFSSEMLIPLFSLAQEERLNVFITKLEHAFENNQIQDITTSAVMELYEYKLATMRHAERATQASLEAASSHSTSLQHRLSQVIAESSRLRQLLFYTQQCLEGSQTEKQDLAAKLRDSEAKASRTHTTQIQEIRGLKKIVNEKSARIEELNSTILKNTLELQSNAVRIEELVIQVTASEKKVHESTTKVNELSRLLRKMEEGSARLKTINEEKSKEIVSNQNEILALKQEVQEQTEQCRIRDKTLKEKDNSIARMKEELTDLSRMREMIYELAKKKEDLNAS